MTPGLSVFVFQEIGSFPVCVACWEGLSMAGRDSGPLGWVSAPKTHFAAACSSAVSRQEACGSLSPKFPRSAPPHRSQECAWGQPGTLASRLEPFMGTNGALELPPIPEEPETQPAALQA